MSTRLLPASQPALTVCTLIYSQVQVREIPLAIQDRVFDTQGQLFYPVNDLDRTQVLPDGAVPPKWIPGEHLRPSQA